MYSSILYSLNYPAVSWLSCSHFGILQSLKFLRSLHYPAVICHYPAKTWLSFPHFNIPQSLNYPALTLPSSSHFTILQPLYSSAVTTLSCKHYTHLQSHCYPALFTLPQSVYCPTVTTLSCSHSTLLQSLCYPAATVLSCSHHTIHFMKPLFTSQVPMNISTLVSFLMFPNLQGYLGLLFCATNIGCSFLSA